MGKVKAKKADKGAEGVSSIEALERHILDMGGSSAKVKLPDVGEVARTYNREIGNAMEKYVERLGDKLERDEGKTSSDDLISAAKGMGLYKKSEEIKDENGKVVEVIPGHITDVAKFMANVKEILKEAKVAMREEFMSLRKAVKEGEITREADIDVEGFAPGQIMGIMNNFALVYNHMNEGREGKTVLLGFGRKFGENIRTLTKLGDRNLASVVLRWRGEGQSIETIKMTTLVPVREEKEFQKKRA